MKRKLTVTLALILMFSLVALSSSRAANGVPVINEFVFNHTGTDTNEFVELFGTPNTDYSTFAILEIEGDSSGAGVVDGVFAVGTTDANGFWTTGFLDNEIENGTVTLLLVQNFTGSGGDDLDTDNDGVLDSAPWDSLVDDVAVSDGGSTDRTYSGVVLEGGFDGITFTPGGASRIPNGTDTDAVDDWVRNDFDGAGLPGFTGTLDLGEALNTPGASNQVVTPPPPPVVTIPEIQGSGQFSPFDGKTVETSGVVTLFTANGNNCWLQDPVGDGDVTTSDGIFVSGCAFASEGPVPEVGDFIRVIASVQEQQFGTSLPLTRLRNVQLIEVLSSDNPLPTPVSLVDLPNEVITDGIGFWEPLEGMLVSIENGFVTSATNGFGEFGMLTRTDAVPGSGYFADTKQILVRDLGEGNIDYNPERIMVDDSSLDEDEAIYVQPGDRVRSMVGVVDYTFSMYKLQPASFDVKTHKLPEVPLSTRSGGFGNVTITTFNVENLFDDFADPNDGKDDEGSTLSTEELETKLSKLALAIQYELNLPDILVVQEVENTAVLQLLGDRVNMAAGTDYKAISFETSDVRGIEVGFLWDASRVTLLDDFQMSGPQVEAYFGPGSASPGREPLVGVFNVTGNLLDPPVTIIGNHFKSKGGDDPLYGVVQPPVRITEDQRKGQAMAVRTFVDSILEADPNALVMVTGDLNDFQFGEPGEGPDHPVAILEGINGGVSLTDLLNLEKNSETFTFVFDGNAQVLDHMLVSPALLDLVAGADILHFNATTPTLLLEGDASNPWSASDHDPLEGRFSFSLAEEKVDFTLTVLHNNDGESELIGEEEFGGVARFKTVVDNLKAEALAGKGDRGVLMVSSGDNFLAGPQFNASLDKGVPFYDTIAMDQFGYNAVAIGNHDFDFNPDVLADFIEGYSSPVPYLSTNLDFSQEPRLQALVDAGRISGSVVVEEGGETFGIIGATTPNIRFISSPRNVIVNEDVAGAVQTEVDKLEAMGVNKIIFISHLQDVDGDIALAAQVTGLDIMVAGGGDELLANFGTLLVPGDEAERFGPYPIIAFDGDGHEIPVVTTSGQYGYVGRLVVGFDKGGDLVSIGMESGPVRVAGGDNPDAVLPDPFVQTAVVDPVVAFVDSLATNIIGTSEIDLDGRRNEVRSKETNEGDLIADALLWQATQLAASFGVSDPDVALQNGGGIRNEDIIPAGPISELDTFDMVPFPNFVSVLENIPRNQFKEILENAVSRTQPGDTPGGTGRFAQIAGFSFTYSASGTAQVLNPDGTVAVVGTRVQEVALDDGTPIVAGGTVVSGPDLTVATIDFLATGGDEYPYRGAPFTTLGVTYQQALANFIETGLGGMITAAQYPVGGEGRITQVP